MFQHYNIPDYIVSTPRLVHRICTKLNLKCRYIFYAPSEGVNSTKSAFLSGFLLFGTI